MHFAEGGRSPPKSQARLPVSQNPHTLITPPEAIGLSAGLEELPGSPNQRPEHDLGRTQGSGVRLVRPVELKEATPWLFHEAASKAHCAN